jgi:hypothetical protein
VIGGFESAVGPMLGMGLVVEAAICERAAEALVEEQKQESELNAFRGQAAGVASAITFQDSMSLELAEIVTELVQSAGFGRKLEGRDHGLVNLFDGPPADGSAVMKENFQ